LLRGKTGSCQSAEGQHPLTPLPPTDSCDCSCSTPQVLGNKLGHVIAALHRGRG
jgi:hypothetical protein